MRWALLVFLVAATVASLTGERMRAQIEVRDTLPLPPNAESIERWGVGLAAPAAMGYWLKFLSTVGGWMVDENISANSELSRLVFKNEERVRWVNAYLEGIVRLAPSFPEPYLYAGIMLYWFGEDAPTAMRFLELAAKNGIDKWEVPFYLGLFRYRAHELEEAARWLTVAARHPKAPALVPLFLTSVTAQLHRPEAGVALLDALLANLPPSMEPFRDLIEADRGLQAQLVSLNEAAAEYERRFGRAPHLVAQLIESGLVSEEEATPKGAGTFMFSDDKVIFIVGAQAPDPLTE